MTRRDHPVVDPSPQLHARPVAAGGWRRALLGLVVGAVAGLLAARALPSAGDAGRRVGPLSDAAPLGDREGDGRR